MTGFPTLADFELRDRIATAFLSAHRSWDGNRPGEPILTDKLTAEMLAGIAVTIFRGVGQPKEGALHLPYLATRCSLPHPATLENVEGFKPGRHRDRTITRPCNPCHCALQCLRSH